MQCLVCANGTSSFIDERFSVTFHACPACELIFRDRADLLGPDAEKAEYDLHENSIEDRGYVDFLRRFLDAAVVPFCPSLPSDLKALDFGSGPAPVLAALMARDYGWNMEIYDPYYAPKRIFEGKKYHLVTCTEVVEHVREPLATFRKLATLLAPGGVLAVMTLFHQNDQARFLNWHYSRDPTHVAFYTPRTMQTLAGLCGLELIFCNRREYTTFRRNPAAASA